MEIKFDIEGRAGLRVLDEFIDGRVIEVQGLNGIGKSVAAQLLEIISGEHVFQRQADFESLKSALKSATISITGLPRECETIQVILSPEKWLFTDEDQVRPDTIGEFFVDGKKSSAEETMSLISTRIIRGNDTILSQMREVMIRNREDVIQKHTITKQNFEIAQGLKQNFLHISPEDNIFVFTRAKESLSLNKVKEDELQTEVARARNILATLRRLLEMKEQIEELQKVDFPTLAERIAKLEIELSDNLKSQEELSKEVESLQTQVASQSEQTQQQANTLATRLVKLEQEEMDIRSNFANKIQQLNLYADDLTPDGLESQLTAIEKDNSDRIDGLDNRWKEVSSYLELAGVGHSLVFRLIPAVEKGFGSKIIGQGEIGQFGLIVLSVSELERLIRNRNSILDREASDLPEEEYKKEAESLRLQRQNILDALSVVKSLRNKMVLRIDLENSLHKLQVSIDEDEAQRVQILKQSLEELRHQELFSRIELSRMMEAHQRLSDYPDLADLSEKYETELSKLNIKEDIRSVYESFQHSQVTSEAKLEELQQQIQDDGDIIRKLGNDFLDQVKCLSNKRDLSFFVLSPNPVTIEEAAASIEEAHQKIKDFVDNSERIHNFIGRVHESINIMLRQLQRKEESRHEYDDIISPLRQIYSDYFVSIYQAPEFLNYVFRGFKDIVRFDMERNEIVLLADDGQEYSRPLSVFSSGERAFAYSLAMIEITGSRKEPNKLLILDEFGALLDYERFEVLKTHLKEKIEKENIADKVIIILPAREDLKERVASLEDAIETNKAHFPTAEKELKHYKELQSSLEIKGYFQYAWNS